ncbi:hypothetical protein [Stenotrophomonas rhizophila]
MAGEQTENGVGNPEGSPPSSGGGANSGTRAAAPGLARDWVVFLKVMLDPYTFVLIVVGALLGWLGPKAVTDNYNAVLQIVIAIVTGVVGARISTAMAAINQEGKLYASGRMAVRGLRLILTKTLALERRVAAFVADSKRQQTSEVRAEVAMRNLDEVLESIRMLQLEVAGSIENWVDVVPDADVSKIFMAVGDLRDQLTQKEDQLREAVHSKELLESKGEIDTQALGLAEARIRELEQDKTTLASQMNSLKQAATQGNKFAGGITLLTASEHEKMMRRKYPPLPTSVVFDSAGRILFGDEKPELHNEPGRPIPP